MKGYNILRKHILDILHTKLPKDLYYHGVHHTLEVMEACKIICKNENVSIEQSNLLLLSTAYHDCGFLEVYHGHESKGGEIAAESLREFGVGNDIIQEVIDLIDSTRIPQNATNHLEAIICDADLDYLGGENYDDIAESLHREFIENEIIDLEQNWIKFQLDFLEKHHYWTNFSRTHREPGKQEVIKRLKVHL